LKFKAIGAAGKRNGIGLSSGAAIGEATADAAAVNDGEASAYDAHTAGPGRPHVSLRTARASCTSSTAITACDRACVGQISRCIEQNAYSTFTTAAATAIEGKKVLSPDRKSPVAVSAATAGTTSSTRDH
jgi:hypothetical protein